MTNYETDLPAKFCPEKILPTKNANVRVRTGKWPPSSRTNFDRGELCLAGALGRRLGKELVPECGENGIVENILHVCHSTPAAVGCNWGRPYSIINEIFIITGMECPICYDRPVTVAAPCGHRFCASCLHRWNTLKSTCPMCRAPLHSLEAIRSNFKIRTGRWLWRSSLKIRGDVLKINGTRYHYTRVRAIAHGDVTTTIFIHVDGRDIEIRFAQDREVFDAITAWFLAASFQELRQNEDDTSRPISAGR